MRHRLALIVAVVLGLIAMYGVHRHMAGGREELRKKFRSIRVAAAAERIKAGTVITPRMFYRERRGGKVSRGTVMPESAVTADHISAAEEDWLVGQTIMRTVERGEPLLASYFRRPVVRLDNKLEHGERALPLRVDAITGVAGNLVPGSRVDILGTFPVASDEKARVGSSAALKTVLLFSDVTVLAVDNRTQEDRFAAPGERRRTYQSVTVAVTPEEAIILVYAQDYGRLTLTLRPPAEMVVRSASGGIDHTNLLQRAAAAEQARQERRKQMSPIRAGN